MSKDENVEEWFDRVLAESGLEEPMPDPNLPVEEIEITEEDIRILLGLDAFEVPGFVYFDERSGAIRGVSQGLEEDLASRYGVLEVPAKTAQDFMSGVSDVGAWLVGYQGEPTPKLLPATIDRLTLYSTAEQFAVVTDTAPAPVQMIVVVPKDEPIGALILAPRPGLKVEIGFSEPFDIVLTRRGEPDNIVARFVIEPAALLETGELPLDLGGIISYDIDILTKPISSVQYVLQPYQEASRPLPLPLGRFVDLLPIGWTERLSESSAGLAVDIYDDRIVAHLHGGGGRFYERGLTAILIAVCRENAPDALLYCERVALEDLRAGPVALPLERPFEDDITVMTQRFFVNNHARNLSRSKTTLPVPALDFKLAEPAEPNVPALLINIDRKDSMVIEVVEGGGRLYHTDRDTMMVTFTAPESLELILWSTEIKLADIQNGVCRVDLPDEIATQNFAIYTSHIYENTFWQFADNDGSRPDRVGDSQWAERRKRGPEVPPPCLGFWIDRSRNLLRVQALSGGGKRNSVSIDEMRIAICAERDAETMICMFKAPVKRLEQGDNLGFPLPVDWHPELVNGNFEVLIQSVYTSAYIFE